MPGYELYGEEEKQALIEWIDSNNGVMFAHGFDKIRNGVYKVREFEKKIADRMKVPYCQVVSSGTSALLVALKALGVNPGDEVITSAFTFVATVEAIIGCGATPVIAEVDETLNINPESLIQSISKKTKCIIPVHMAGTPADMTRIMEIASLHNLLVLEDCAQAFGGTYKGEILGTIGDAGIYSFDFAKNITTGEGGAIVTRNKDVYERARAYHDHGHEYTVGIPRGRDTRSAPGFNFRMTEAQAVLGIVQLTKLDGLLKKQRENKKELKEGLRPALNRKGYVPRKVLDTDGDIADSFIFFMRNEKEALDFAQNLSKTGLGTKNLPDALDWHFAETWRHMLPEGCAFPETGNLLRRAISLPINVYMDVPHVVKTISDIMER
jgi:8-amino-3,8-dideoxy-alpha-D-manno-octulosonate transaminase